MLEEGIGVKADLWSAGEWYSKSASQGSAAGASSLALWYCNSGAIVDAAKCKQADKRVDVG